MKSPEYLPTITLGNLISIGMLLASIFTFAVTTATDVRHLNEWRQTTEQTVDANSIRITKLEGFRDQGPRFTISDGALLKQQAVSEATTLAFAADAKIASDMNGLSTKLDEVNKTLVQIRIILAENKMK
jgi:hypothetical protein